MNTNSKIINTSALIIILFLLFPSLLHGRQKSIESDTSLPLSLNGENSNIERYGHNFFWSTDSGENWSSITVGYSVYLYGKSVFGDNTAVNTAEAIRKISSGNSGSYPYGGSFSKPSGSISVLKNKDSFKPVSTVSYLIKITKYYNLRISTQNGEKSYKVSKGKLTEGIYCIKLNNSSFEKTLYYYKLENEKGTKTRTLLI